MIMNENGHLFRKLTMFRTLFARGALGSLTYLDDVMFRKFAEKPWSKSEGIGNSPNSCSDDLPVPSAVLSDLPLGDVSSPKDLLISISESSGEQPWLPKVRFLR